MCCAGGGAHLYMNPHYFIKDLRKLQVIFSEEALISGGKNADEAILRKKTRGSLLRFKFLKGLFQPDRRKANVVCGAQPVFHPVEAALNGQPVAFRMKMTIAAERDAVALQQRKNLRAFIAPVAGRIVQEAVFFLFPRPPVRTPPGGAAPA